MLTVIFVVTTVISVLAVIIFAIGLVRLTRDKPGASDILTAGLGIWLFAVVAAAVIFGFFT
jgi:hypothetical protein